MYSYGQTPSFSQSDDLSITNQIQTVTPGKRNKRPRIQFLSKRPKKGVWERLKRKSFWPYYYREKPSGNTCKNFVGLDMTWVSRNFGKLTRTSEWKCFFFVGSKAEITLLVCQFQFVFNFDLSSVICEMSWKSVRRVNFTLYQMFGALLTVQMFSNILAHY